MEDVDEHYELLSKARLTIEGILASGRSDIWSTYGGLRRAREILFRIFSHGLQPEIGEEELLSYLLDQKGKTTESGDAKLAFDSLDPTNLEQFIEDGLLGYCTSAIIENSFLNESKGRAGEIYSETAFLRIKSCVKCLKTCISALEQNSLELLTSISETLSSKMKFSQYIEEEKLQETVDLDCEDGKNSLSTSGPDWTSKYPSYSYSVSSGDENFMCEKQESSDECFDNQKDDIIFRDPNAKYITSDPQKAVKRRSFHQDVLMNSALAAVMETNEDNLVWFNDSDRKKLLDEPSEAARSRLARMREISRSESSLFQEHGLDEGEASKEVEDNNQKGLATQVKLNQVELKVTDQSKLKKDADQSPVMLKRSSKVLTAPPFKKGHSRSKSDQMGTFRMTKEIDVKDGGQEKKLSTSAPAAQPEENRHQDYYYQPEDGYMFPKPYKGQSLISYLESRSYDTGAELDKENAHFSICEALITAIEQMKCSKFFDSDSDDSDEEIRSLKRKINEKKLRKKMMKIETQKAFSDRSTSTTSQSTSSFFSGSSFSTSSTGSASDETIPKDTTSQKTLSRSWENVSLSPRNSKNLLKKNDSSSTVKSEDSSKEESKPDDYSAEVVAKSLLKKFAGRKLPAASDLKWIVSEDQVPQTILPLPNAWPVSPDDALNNGWNISEDDMNAKNNLRKWSMPTRLRGNFEWAPPRPQIIFTPHPYVKRKVLVQKQHYRCAGCGLKVTPSLSKRFRYCEYLGKYFCTSCHQNRMAVLPSKIINKWDFKLYPVSDFAFDFLNKMQKEPLFNLSAIDGSIYKKIKATETCRELRLKLHYAKGFLKTCRHAESIYKELLKFPSHIFDDVHLYSLEDFVQVKNGDLQSNLKSLNNFSLKHINDCQLCGVKGFVCEYCKDGNDILYPFNLNKVATCPFCKTCYHKNCFVPEKCPKCERIRARQRLLESKSSELEH